MKISQFSVGASRTINLGNFESLRVEASVTVDVDDNDQIRDGARIAAQTELRKLMAETYNNMTKKKELKSDVA